jgi:hypothetical protein
LAAVGSTIRRSGHPPGFAQTLRRRDAACSRAIGQIAYRFNSQRMMRRYAAEAYLR